MENTLFIITHHMTFFLAGYLKHCLCLDVKLEDSDSKLDNNINLIYKTLKKHNLKTIFFLYNCSYINRVVNYKLNNNITVNIIAWHQKNYFPAKVVKHLYKIMEYSIVQCQKNSHYDPSNSQKYELFHYPAILPPDVDTKFEELPQEVKARYNNKYIYSGGNNNRNYRMIIKIATQFPQYSFIFNLSERACKKYIKSDINNIPNNLKIYINVTPTEFLYAIKNAHILLLPYRKPKSTVGHSTVAQGIYYKKPIISSTNSSMDESISNGQTGYLVDIGDIKTTMKKVKTLMEDDNVYGNMVDKLNMIQNTRTIEYYINRIKEVLYQQD